MPAPDRGLGSVVERIADLRASTSRDRSLLVAVSGIDGSGKGHLTGRITAALRDLPLRTAAINADEWLNLPHVRFNLSDPAGHFYRHAIRFEEMFARLVLPLRDRRSLRLVADVTEETATAYRAHLYEFNDIDVVLLEGIFLVRPELSSHYDLLIWVDCSFETALARAVSRAQEGLSPEKTLHAYRTVYFPAQQIHFERDRPRERATLILENDPRLGPSGVSTVGLPPPFGRL